MATKEKPAPVLLVGYSDQNAVVTVTDPSDDSEVESISTRELAGEDAGPAVICPLNRYYAGGLRDVIAAGMKAGKALSDILGMVGAYVKAVHDGTLQFRERGGEGGLSLEQEFEIIAGVLVELQGITLDEAKAKVAKAYADTKEVVTPAKGTPGTDGYKAEKRSIVHPTYRKLRNVSKVAEAIAKAEKVDPVSELAAIGI